MFAFSTRPYFIFLPKRIRIVGKKNEEEGEHIHLSLQSATVSGIGTFTKYFLPLLSSSEVATCSTSSNQA
jgi:hypothetical protein